MPGPMIRFESGAVSPLFFEFKELATCRQVDRLNNPPCLYEVGCQLGAYRSDFA